MRIDGFIKPRLTGARFDGRRIPLEVLGDLAVLQEMLVEVAKWEFLQQHPGRARSPRGFTEGVSFELTAIEDGSAVPVISLVLAGATALFQPENQAYFEQARDAIVRAIDAAEHNQPVKAHLPEKVLPYFDKMGRSLRAGEAMEFTTPNHAQPARLTKESRRNLILASDVKEVSEDVTVRGQVTEADKDKLTFELLLSDGRKITAPMPEQHQETIVKAFAEYKKGARTQVTRIRVDGVGRYSRQGKLEGIESVAHVTILDPLDVPARLDEVRGLKDGWLDGKGKAPDPVGIEWLAMAFAEKYPELKLPYLYPTAEGGIQVEWTLRSNEVSLEIVLGNHHGQWHVLNTETDKEESRELDLDSDADWQWLAKQIEGMGGGIA